MLRSLLICIFSTLLSGFAYSQTTLQGTIIDYVTRSPLQGVKVTTLYPDETTTDEMGRFSIRHPAGEPLFIMIERGRDFLEWKPDIRFSADTDPVEIGTYEFQSSGISVTQPDIPTITIQEEDAEDHGNISGLLQAGTNLFDQVTGYTFSTARFRRRGLGNEYYEGYLNQVPVNDLASGSVFFSNWSGLNNAFYLTDEVMGAEFADWAFGDLATTFNVDLRASSMRKTKRISYAVTNRNYRNRIMATLATGATPSGWAITLSGSRRWAQEGYIPGTFYDGWSYFGSVSKKLNDNHSLHLVAFASPYKRGGSAPVIAEMHELADDHYYNPYWGFQQGEKRNSRVYQSHQPMVILRHDWLLNEKLNISTSLAYQTGRNAVEALDWLNANDPRPDYYRRLPSYVDDTTLAAQMRELLSTNESLRQIQWDKMYEVNLNSLASIANANGMSGNTVTGRLSQYVMEERRSDVDHKTGNLVLQYLLSEMSTITAGVHVIMQDTRHYKVLADLLGGEFYVDWDKFAAQDFPGNEEVLQNDLQRPNRIIREGDQFGYDYDASIRQQGAWASYYLNGRKFEIGLGGSIKNQSFWRSGNVQNGKFPDRSLGDSEKNNFLLPAGKALVRYKFDGRNYLTVSGLLSEKAPSFRNAYISPRTRDHVANGLTTEKITSGEIRYDMRSPYLRLSVAGYHTITQDGMETTSFYHEDERTFVNFTLTGIDRQYSGVEAAAQYTILPGLSAEAGISIGQFIHSSRPTATITQDNDGAILQENITIYAKNFYVSGTPQRAYTAGVNYSSKNFWSVYLNVNRFENNWIDFNPLRRTAQAVQELTEGSEAWNTIIQQEKTDPAWTVDLSFYKSWLVNWPEERALVALNLGVTNLLNNTNYISGGFEQYRFDFEESDINTFPTKYSYMWGLNFFVQGSLRF